MVSLEENLKNIDKDNEFKVIDLIKKSPYSATEKVCCPKGNVYIRKYFDLSQREVKNEYEILKKVNHPLFPKVIDYYELSGQGVLIEEYVQGKKLETLIEAYGPFETAKAVDLVKKICQGFVYLHNCTPPIIHRDLKPDNIIYSPEDGVRVIDFGAAREHNQSKSKDTVYVGTLGYAPPEQFGFGQTDPRSDIYGLGMTFLHLLTGQRPQRGKKSEEEEKVLYGDVKKIIDKATQFDPERRYQNMEEMMADLDLLTSSKAKAYGLKIKKAFGERADGLYPKGLPWPKWVKTLLFIVHGFFALALVAIVISAFQRTEFSRKDDILRFLNNITIYVFIFLPSYILGFNVFDINRRIAFLQKRKGLKKIGLVIAFMIIGVVLVIIIDSNFSQAYQLAKNSAGS